MLLLGKRDVYFSESHMAHNVVLLMRERCEKLVVDSQVDSLWKWDSQQQPIP